jgi:hypothetical protein
MNKKFESRYKISNEIWEAHVKKEVEYQRKEMLYSLESNGEDPSLLEMYDDFYEFELSGDIETYFDREIEKGHSPNWSAVAHNYPRKDFDQYIENVKYFWNWFFEDPENRYPRGQSHPGMGYIGTGIFRDTLRPR